MRNADRDGLGERRETTTESSLCSRRGPNTLSSRPHVSPRSLHRLQGSSSDSYMHYNQLLARNISTLRFQLRQAWQDFFPFLPWGLFPCNIGLRMRRFLSILVTAGPVLVPCFHNTLDQCRSRLNVPFKKCRPWGN